MYLTIHEWDKENNTEKDIAVLGDTPEYPEFIREIVQEIARNGYSERGDSIYTGANAEEDEEE